MKALPGPTSGRPAGRSGVSAMPGPSGSLDALPLFWLPALCAVLALVVATITGGAGEALLVVVVFFGGVGILAGCILRTSRQSQRRIDAGLEAARRRQILAYVESLPSEPAPLREVTVTATVLVPSPQDALTATRTDEPASAYLGTLHEPDRATRPHERP